MAVYNIAASAEGLSRMDGSDRKLWERTRLGKNVNKNVNKQLERKTRDLMSPGRLNGRNVVGDVLLLNNVNGT